MNFFIRQAPIILTDTLFERFGGNISNSTQDQRKSAFVMAEYDVETDLGTFLLPTTVTGTYLFATPLQLDHTYVHSVSSTHLLSNDGSLLTSITGTSNRHVALRDAEYGLVDMWLLTHGLACGLSYPYQLEIVYTAGLPSGTSYTPPVLGALAIQAGIHLNEMIGYGNEAPGDAGVKSFSNQDYSEERYSLKQTTFGPSPRANYVHKLLTPLRKYRSVGMGRPIR